MFNRSEDIDGFQNFE